jgi:hypothetical protein
MKALRSISAVVLALLVLISSTSFMVGMHLCMGEVQNIALFAKAEGCEKEQSLPPCHRHTNAPCCEDETVIHETDDFKASAAHYHVAVPVPIDIEQPLILISEVIPTTPLARFKYHHYDPPLRSCDLTVEHRVFLI